MFFPNFRLCRSFVHSQTYTLIFSLPGDILFAMFDPSTESNYVPLLRTPLASRPLNLPLITTDGLKIHDRKASHQRQCEGQIHSLQLGPQGNPRCHLNFLP